MPATAALIAMTLAVAQPPRPAERPLAMLQTTWSLSAAPRAIAAAYGPSDAPALAPSGKPASSPEPDGFDELVDPAAPAAAAAAAATAPVTAPPPATAAADDPLANDPFAADLAEEIKPSSDPLEGFNRASFAVSMALDKALLRPLALGYQQITPKPARDGLRNVLNNLSEPVTFVNDLLQLRPQRAVRTLGRFLLNSVLGLGGLFDIAREKKFNLPRRNNSFSNTLAYYGVGPGPYIYIPILGPTTLRGEVDRVEMVLPWVTKALRNGRGTASTVLIGLDDRADNDRDLKVLLDDAVDPYATFRETWLQDQAGEIARLKAPDGADRTDADPLSDPLTDPAAPVGPAAVIPAP